MKKLFIVVLSFNAGKKIVACLKSLQSIKVPRGWQVKVLVVENTPKKNLGFAGGMNVGIKDALENKADAVMLLNQDTVVEKGFLTPLLASRADVVAPVMKFRRGGKWVYDLGGKVDWRTGRVRHLEFNSCSINELTSCELDYVSGCAMLIRRPVFEKIGLLDEKYFLYFEDADFCLRAQKAGFQIVVEPRAVVRHRLAATTQRPWRQNYHLLRSQLIFINRYLSVWRRPLGYFYWWLLSAKILLEQFL